MRPAITPSGLRARAAVLRAVRDWFEARGFVEVSTPVRVPSPAMEATLDAVPAGEAWLRTSPEMALKRVVAAGMPRVVEIGPCFRAHERGRWHGTEFTLCEWYRVGGRLDDLAQDVAGIVRAAFEALDREPPASWHHHGVRELIATHTGHDLATVSAEVLSPEDADDLDAAFFRRWVADVEPRLPPACFVTGWPASQAALAQVRRHTAWPVARRLEAYVHGVELANGFEELTDAAEQRDRFASSSAQRRASGALPHPTDEAFIEAVGRLPPTAGIALGVDRLVAIAAGWDAIAPGVVRHPDLA